MFRNFDLFNKPVYCKRDLLQAFEAKVVAELFVSNCTRKVYGAMCYIDTEYLVFLHENDYILTYCGQQNYRNM